MNYNCFYRGSNQPDTRRYSCGTPPPRKAPYLLKDKLKKELDRMEKNDIIYQVEEPSDYGYSRET